MGENLIPEIAEMLGVENCEKFKLNDEHSTLTYMFENGRLVYYDDEHETMVKEVKCNELVKLISGGFRIIKLPWKPKVNEMYYTFSKNKDGDRLGIERRKWIKAIGEIALFKMGWVYQTLEAAETDLPIVANKLNIKYE